MQWQHFYLRELQQDFSYIPLCHNDAAYDTFLAALPVDVVLAESSTVIPTVLPRLPPPVQHHETFRDALQSLDLWESELVSEFKLTPGTTIDCVLQVLQQQQLVLATDG